MFRFLLRSLPWPGIECARGRILDFDIQQRKRQQRYLAGLCAVCVFAYEMRLPKRNRFGRAVKCHHTSARTVQITRKMKTKSERGQG